MTTDFNSPTPGSGQQKSNSSFRDEPRSRDMVLAVELAAIDLEAATGFDRHIWRRDILASLDRELQQLREQPSAHHRRYFEILMRKAAESSPLRPELLDRIERFIQHLEKTAHLAHLADAVCMRCGKCSADHFGRLTRGRRVLAFCYDLTANSGASDEDLFATFVTPEAEYYCVQCWATGNWETLTKHCAELAGHTFAKGGGRSTPE